MKPKFSIVIPVLNHLEDCLKPCLNSILQFSDMSETEVIIIANGCNDGTEDYVDSLNNPAIRIIRFDKPLGYTRATNVGIQNAKGDYIVLLNSDTILLEQNVGDWLHLLSRPFEEDSKMGITGVTEIWDANSGYDFIIFYCAMLTRSVINRFGLLAEDFGPGGGEDIEYSIRVQRGGFKIQQVPIKQSELWQYSNWFPLYHAAEATVKHLPYWENSFVRNMDKLHRQFRLPIRTSIVVAAMPDADLLQRCIQSVWKHTSYEEVEVIIIYDETNEQQHTYLKTLAPYGPYRLVPTNGPLGYDDAVRAGIGEAAGQFVVVLNGKSVLLNQSKGEWLKILLSPLKDVSLSSVVVRDGEIASFCFAARRSDLFDIHIDNRLAESLAQIGKQSVQVPSLPLFFPG